MLTYNIVQGKINTAEFSSQNRYRQLSKLIQTWPQS